MATDGSARTARDPADGWVGCGCGARHWGLAGAAGLLLTDGTGVVMQHRVGWSHFGGTWGIPGGALHQGEDAVAGALREAAEEAGVDTGAVTIAATSVLTHPDWSYTTVLARCEPGMPVAPTDPESLAIEWVPLPRVTGRPLLPAFAEAWSGLADMLATSPHVVIDAANVVGSVPDGWWRDRAGAAERLRNGLHRAAADGVPADALGLPGARWWPRWHLVVEGQARGVTASERVDVVAADGSGDDAIVALTRSLTPERVIVVTADRALGERVRAYGAHAVGPRWLPSGAR